MGDVIAVLKHAKKVYSEVRLVVCTLCLLIIHYLFLQSLYWVLLSPQELKKKNSSTSSGKSSAKVVPIAHCPPVSKDKPSQVIPTAEGQCLLYTGHSA